MQKYDPKKIEKKRILNEKEATYTLKNLLKTYQQDPSVLAEAFEFASNFYNYSPKNTQLIFAQNSGATYCQSYLDWKKMGYSVLRNETGLKVWIPYKVTLLQVDNNTLIPISKASPEQVESYKKGNIKSIQKIKFGIGTTFDISQTNFPKELYPKLFYMGYSSDQHLLITRGIEDFSFEKLNCPVLQTDFKSISLRGCYSPSNNLIKINCRLEDTQRLCTTLHELGHAMIHSTISNKTTSQKELEADALSIMMQSNFGIELSDSRKRHFKEHYEQFASQCQKLGKSIDDSINDVFQTVYDVYRQYINDINQYIDKVPSIDTIKSIDLSSHTNRNHHKLRIKSIER